MTPNANALHARTSSLARIWGVPMALAAAAALAGCGGGGGGSSVSSGTLKLALSDAPSCGYDAVFVTVDRVRVHQSSAAADTDAGWSEVALSPARRVDLLTLTNGVLDELGQTALPAGKYTQLRLVLAANGASDPLANAVEIGGVTTALDTPSGQQSGLKTNIDIDVAADKVADFVLDFHVCESIVKRGNSGRYNLKPVLSMLPRLSDAGMRIVGYLDPALATVATTVSAQQNGVPMRATPPDVTGKFVLYPVPAGNYDVVVNAAGRATAVVTGVPVVTTGYTYVNADTARINPAMATLHSATGSVSTGVTPVDATVRVLKAYSGGPTVELGVAPVDSVSGGYAFTLPANAALKAAYVANLAAPLVFSADAAVPPGRYSFEATSGAAPKQQLVDLSGGDVTLAPFVFP